MKVLFMTCNFSVFYIYIYKKIKFSQFEKVFLFLDFPSFFSLPCLHHPPLKHLFFRRKRIHLLPALLVLTSQDTLFTAGQIPLSLMFPIRITSEKEPTPGCGPGWKPEFLTSPEHYGVLLPPSRAFSSSLSSLSYTRPPDAGPGERTFS